jgi:hypothetical protein
MPQTLLQPGSSSVPNKSLSTDNAGKIQFAMLYKVGEMGLITTQSKDLPFTSQQLGGAD